MKPQAKQILLVDDEEKLLKSIAQRLAVLGFVPHTATDGLTAIDIAKQHPIDMAIVDLQMPDMNGLVTITKLKEIKPNLKTVLLTGHGNDKVKQATESLNTLYFEKDEMGEFWNFIKNLKTDGHVVVIRPAATPTAKEGLNPSAQNEIVIHSADHYALHAADEAVVQAGPGHPAEFTQLRIVGETAAMQELKKNISRVVPLDCTVLLAGEDGTGKELAARVIHARGRRRHLRFLAIDCGDLASDQFVLQLFGYGEGDLLAAIQSQRGIFGPPPIGTLLFDRVEAMPPAMQSQLLTTIDTMDRAKAVADHSGSADIRIMVATETDLEKRVEKGRFDRQLYERLSVFSLFIPPLRDRKDDIPPLCSYFLRKFSDDFKKVIESIDPEVIETLSAYDFPGNVRELAHLIERAVILTDGRRIEKRHLPERFIKAPAASEPAGSGNFLTLAELENRHILEVLAATQGNKSKTAEILGISRAALWRKLKQRKADSTDP